MHWNQGPTDQITIFHFSGLRTFSFAQHFAAIGLFFRAKPPAMPRVFDRADPQLIFVSQESSISVRFDRIVLGHFPLWTSRPSCLKNFRRNGHWWMPAEDVHV
jgi:hypothetical protein